MKTVIYSSMLLFLFTIITSIGLLYSTISMASSLPPVSVCSQDSNSINCFTSTFDDNTGDINTQQSITYIHKTEPDAVDWGNSLLGGLND